MKHSLLALSYLSVAVSALKLPLYQIKRDTPARRQSTSNGGTSAGQMIAVSDNLDLIYLVNMTIGGEPHTLQLDTGSSDLWVGTTGAVSGNVSHLNLNLTYGIGYAYGSIATADVVFSGFTIPVQAYLAANQVNNPATTYGADGILGLGHTSLSSIDMAVNQTGASWGRSMLYNIFSLNPTEPNYMTILLERVSDPNQQTTGTFTIGETDPRYAGIVDTPRISTYPEQDPIRWSLILDSIIANGKKIPSSSVVQGVPSGKSVALIDTGTSLVYASANIVAAIYGNIAGAMFSDSTGQWTVPCDAEVDVSIIIDGRQMDIHPLDTVQPTSSGSQTCVGSWISQSLSVGKSEFDVIFGDCVMRSMYTLLNYGDFKPGGGMDPPYFQLWSLVNGSDASSEFHQVRGGSSSSTFLSNDNVNAASSSNSSSSTGNSSSDISDLQTKIHNILKWAPVVIGVAALNVIVMLVVLIVSIAGCVRRRRNDRSTGPSGSFVPLPLGTSAHNYRPVSLQEVSKYNSGARYSD